MPIDRPFPGPSGLPDPDLQAAFYAGVPAKRLLAWLIDALVIGVLVLAALPLTVFIGVLFMPVLFLVLGFAYRFITIAGASATPGMRLMAIEFRDRAGQRFDGSLALSHTLLFTLACAVAPLQLVSAVLMATSARGQGLGDMLLGTTAINRAAAA